MPPKSRLERCSNPFSDSLRRGVLGSPAAPRSTASPLRQPMLLEQGPVVLPRRLHDALLSDTPSAEGRNERTVLAAQDDHVGVRLVEVVVELGEHLLAHAHLLAATAYRKKRTRLLSPR